MFEIGNEWQGDEAQHPQWCHSMETIKSITDITYFALTFTTSEILTLQFSNFENLSQCHGVQHSHGCHPMTSINLYKSHNTHCTLVLIVSRILTFKNVDLENLGQGHDVQHSQS